MRIRYLRALDPKAPIVDSYEKDPELVDDMIDEITEIDEDDMFYRFWEYKRSLKYISKLHSITSAEVKATLQDIAMKLLSVEPEKEG